MASKTTVKGNKIIVTIVVITVALTYTPGTVQNAVDVRPHQTLALRGGYYYLHMPDKETEVK